MPRDAPADGAADGMNTLPVTVEPHTDAAENRLRLFEWVLPVLGVCSLFAACIVWSLRKQMWADEVFTRTEVGDPSLMHLLRALPRLGGGGMPLFSLTAWPWAHLFGLSDLSLRLYSSVGMCASFLLLVAVLRRRFGACAAYLGAAFAMFACMTVLEQNAEARGYGLYLLLCVAAIAQWLRVAEKRQPGVRDLTLLALSQAGLVLGHVLGLIYAGLMLAALLAADAWERRFRARVYLSLMAGWLALVPWIPAIRASMAVGKPHGWIPVPGLGDLAMGISFWLFSGIYYPLLQGSSAGLGLGWAVALFCVIALIVAAIHGVRTADSGRRAAYLLGLALMLGPVVFFLVSWVATPIFVARYMIPSVLGLALLCACWAERSGMATGRRGVVLGFLTVLLPVATAVVAKPLFLDVAEVDRMAGGRPVVCDWVRDFAVMLRYSAEPAAVEYPMDWPTALAGPGIGIGGYHLLDNYRREGYLRANVRDDAEVLKQGSFVVLDEKDSNWFRAAIEKDPEFRWKVLTQLDKDHRLIAVEHKE